MQYLIRDIVMMLATFIVGGFTIWYLCSLMKASVYFIWRKIK